MEDRELIAIMASVLYAGIQTQRASYGAYSTESAVNDAFKILEIISTKPLPVRHS